jgi:hypothetical protein
MLKEPTRFANGDSIPMELNVLGSTEKVHEGATIDVDCFDAIASVASITDAAAADVDGSRDAASTASEKFSPRQWGYW